jgi:hypothetical protein
MSVWLCLCMLTLCLSVLLCVCVRAHVRACTRMHAYAWVRVFEINDYVTVVLISWRKSNLMLFSSLKVICLVHQDLALAPEVNSCCSEHCEI